MSENKDNKLTLINEKTANDYLTHTMKKRILTIIQSHDIIAKKAEKGDWQDESGN